ncbi:MAG: hypothetical protein QOE71_1627 [Pseudonocardiales bacterium]|jgi:hypothetical protein|nr:hypothetical protein [Pseudonocardiales bacterium]
MAEPVELRLDVDAGGDADAEEVAELTRGLREQLVQLDVDDVELVRSGPAPAGAKGLDVMAVGSLIVSLASSGGLASLVASILSWVGGSAQRSIKLSVAGDTLEMTGITSEQQQRLIDDWLSRHATS